MKMEKMKYVLIGILTSLAVFLLFGISTALIPTNLFKRMVQARIVDYIFLASTSAMLGAFIALRFYALHLYKRQRTNTKNICSKDYAATGGTITSIFAFSCPTCNILLILLFGVSAVLLYFEPLRPIFGVIGITILGAALYLQIRNIIKH